MTGELAGTLRQSVTVLRQAPDRDAAGAASGAWLPLATVPAAVVPDGVGATELGDALSARPRWLVTLRPADVLVGDRLGWGNRRLAVRAVTADPRTPDRITLACEEEA